MRRGCCGSVLFGLRYHEMFDDQPALSTSTFLNAQCCCFTSQVLSLGQVERGES